MTVKHEKDPELKYQNILKYYWKPVFSRNKKLPDNCIMGERMTPTTFFNKRIATTQNMYSRSGMKTSRFVTFNTINFSKPKTPDNQHAINWTGNKRLGCTTPRLYASRNKMYQNKLYNTLSMGSTMKTALK